MKHFGFPTFCMRAVRCSIVASPFHHVCCISFRLPWQLPFLQEMFSLVVHQMGLCAAEMNLCFLVAVNAAWPQDLQSCCRAMGQEKELLSRLGGWTHFSRAWEIALECLRISLRRVARKRARAAALPGAAAAE